MLLNSSIQSRKEQFWSVCHSQLQLLFVSLSSKELLSARLCIFFILTDESKIVGGSYKSL